MGKHLSFQVLSEKTLHHAVNPNLISYCPSMDLVALVTTDQQIFIYRMNGQRVYGASQKVGGLRVESIQWKPNGQLLAIAWTDGSIRLVGAESSKIVYQFGTVQGSSGITCLGWATNLTNRTSSSMNLRKGLKSWGGLLAKDLKTPEDVSSLDLPRDLSLIDIERSLPKLSILSSAGSLDDVFCSRSSLDDLFRPFDPLDNNSVDVMVAGTQEGNIHLSIYDSFVIGSFKSPFKIFECPSQLIRHAAHMQCSTHALLVKPTQSENIFFVPMDLRFISASSVYLSLLASRSTALHNLLRYIHQVQALMVVEWKATRDLPSRFIRNVNETLEEKGNRDIFQALYHSVATGHTFPDVREWLVNELSERGHKRWDKAVTTGLENLRRLVHENMLPALERFSVILSRFAGIARFRGSNDVEGFSTQQISLMMDTVACIHLVSSRILIQVVDELELFTSFSAWLRYEIDRLASDSSSAPDDPVEKEASIDHSKVILYLQKIMTTNPLSIFFDDSASEGHPGWNHAEQGVPLFDLLKRQLEKQERKLPYIKALPRVDLLCAYLSRQANSVFTQIAEAEKRNVLFGRPQDLGIPRADGPLDMKMTTSEESICRAHIAYIAKGMTSTLHVIQIALVIERGISTLKSTDFAATTLGRGEVKDVKFFDDNTLLVLWKSRGKSYLLGIPYNDPHSTMKLEFGNFEMAYTPYTPGTEQSHSVSFGDEETLRLFAKYSDSISDSFAPDKIEVRMPSGSAEREDMRRIVLLSQDRLHYRVLKINGPELKKSAIVNRDEDISMSWALY